MNLYHQQKFTAKFTGIGLNRTDTVVFVNAKRFLSCNDVNRTRPRVTVNSYYQYYDVSSANYYETTATNIALGAGEYRVCYFHRMCVHEVGMVKVKPTLD